MDLNPSSPVTSFPPISGQPVLIPPEIMVEIFLLSLPPTDLAQAPQKTILALVCRLWNSIIESTPILWSRISIADTRSYIQKSLLKSGKHPIDVDGARLIDDSWLDVGCDGMCCDFMEDIMWHSDRWRHAALQISCNQTLYGPTVLKTPLNTLESLQLYSDGFGELHSELLKLLKQENAPHLREVLLDSTGLPSWDISFPSSLSTLIIRDILESCPSLTQILSILVTCPNLTVFHLGGLDVNVGPDGPVYGHAGEPTVIELASLQELKLEWLPSEVVQDLLGRLGLPEECTISIGCRIGDASPSTSFLTPTLSRFYKSFYCAEKIKEVTVILDETDLRLGVVGRWRWDITLALSGAHALQDSLDWFCIRTERGNYKSHSSGSPTYFTVPSTTPVFLKLGDIPAQSEYQLLTSISTLECITRIKAPNDSEHQKSILWYLSGCDYPSHPSTNAQDTDAREPSSSSHTTEAHPFPGLRELVVNGMELDVLRAVINVIRSRSDRNAIPGAVGKPAQLRRVKFVGENDEDLQNGDHRSALGPRDARRKLLFQLLQMLGNEAELFWGGMHISSAEFSDG